MVMLFISLTCIMAQAVSDYAFATATNGSLEDMSTGTTDILNTGTYQDSGASTVANIGFTFTFGGVAYTQFSANSNGLMRLGGTVISGYSTSPVATTPILGPISGDNSIQATGKIHYKVVGSVAPRKLVVEWMNLRVNYGSSSTGTFCTMQVWLYENTNKIDFVYGTMYNMSASAQSRSVFISTGTTSGAIGSVATIVTTPSWVTTGTSAVTSSFTASSYMTNLNSAADGSRRVFTFTPPDPLAVPNPAIIASPGNAATLVASTATLNWTSGGGLPTGYKLYFGTDGAGSTQPSNIVSGTNLGNVLTYNPDPDMLAGTTYYWQIVPTNANGDAVSCPIWSFTTLPEGYIQVGAGTSTQAKPFGTTWGYERSAALYTAAQIGSTGSLDEIAWYCVATTATVIPYKIYAKTTTNTAQTAQTWDSFVSGAQLLKQGTYSFTTSGWKIFTLDTPFPYVSGNLIIGVETSYGGSGGGSGHTFYYTTGTTGSHQYWNTDTNPPTGNGSLNTQLPNVLLHLGELAETPELAVSPTSWDFGQQIINTTATKQFTVSNIGGGTLTLTNVVASGSYYSISVAPVDMELTTGESTTFTVQYLPTAAGNPQTGTVTITDTRTTNTEINLTGSCVDPTITELPFTESFDSVTVPALPLGWSTRVTDTSTYGYVKTVTTNHTTPNGVALYNSSDSASDLILITPLLSPALNTVRVKFWAYGSGYPLIVGSTDVAGQSAVFTAQQTVTLTASWAQYSVSFADYAGTNHFIAFKHGQGSTYRTIYIDDVTIEVPAAIPPEAATLVAPANAGLTLVNPLLKWAPSATGEPVTGYNVYMNDSGTFGPADIIYTGANTSFQTTTTSFERTYYWQVVPYNTHGDTTGCPVWSFYTPLETQLAESFEPTGFPPAGWANPGTWSRNTSYYKDGVASAYKYGSGSSQYVLSGPRCTITGTSTLDFWSTAASTSGILQVVYSPDRTTWTQIGANVTYATAYTMINTVVDLSSLAGNNYYLGFRTGLYATSYYVDMVIGPEITAELPGPVTQTAPADLAIDQVRRPTLTWTAPVTGGVPTGYKIYCDLNNPPTTLVTTVTASPYTFTTDLNWEATYYWMVVANNGAGDAVGSTVRSFTVMADPTIYDMPYLMTFDDMGTTFPPVGWSRMNGLYGGTYVAGTQWVQDDWLNVATPTNKAANINIYGTTRYGWLVTPPVAIPTADYELKFDMGLVDYDDTFAPVAGEQADDKLIVVMSDSPLMTSPTILREWNNSGSTDVYDSIPAAGENYVITLTGITGTKYFAFYGESTVSGGDNDLMVDNIIFRQIPAGAPDNVTLNSPINHADTVNPRSVTLSWTPALTGGNPDGYSIFVGENPIDPANEYFGDYEYSTTNTTFDLSAEDIVIGYGQTLYWAVWPFNGEPVQYPDPLSPSFQTFDFTTIPDPRIISLPYAQNFDSVTAPALPTDWTAYTYSASSPTYVYVKTTTSTPNTAPNNVGFYNSGDTAASLILISPQATISIPSMKMDFYARASDTVPVLQVGTMTDPANPATFTMFQSVALTSTNTLYSVDWSTYAGTDQYFAFKMTSTGTYDYIYLDTILMEEILANDMAAMAVSGPGIGVAGTQLSYSVTVKNNGTASQASYNVHLKRYGDDRFASLPITTPLAPGATAVHTINWTPATAGDYVIVGEVELTGDEYAGNNESATMNTSIYAAGTFIPQIGNIASETSSHYTAIDVYYKNSLSETIYLAQEMQATSGTINAIIYQNNFTQNVTKPIKIWMKHTTEANLSTAFLPFAGYDLVFEGNVYMPIGVNAIVIPLDTPYAYTGGNLAVRVYGVWETFYSLSSNVFYYTATPEYPSRTRYFVADQTAAFDPIALTDYLSAPFTGTLTNNVANTAFVMEPAVPITSIVAPELAVSQNGVNAKLDWNLVAGAYAYRVYASDDPYVFAGAPIATVYTNTYNAPFATNAKKFYKVTAVTYHHTDRAEVMNPAAVIGFDNSKVKVISTEKFTTNKD